MYISWKKYQKNVENALNYANMFKNYFDAKVTK